MKFSRLVTALGLIFLLWSTASGEDFKVWEAKTKEYKQWLDTAGSDGTRFWLRLDGSRRPCKLFVGEGFYKADLKSKEEFVEIFSHYLAGHPDKFALIDLYDGGTGTAIGEFGWGGFKLFRDEVRVNSGK